MFFSLSVLSGSRGAQGGLSINIWLPVLPGPQEKPDIHIYSWVAWDASGRSQTTDPGHERRER